MKMRKILAISMAMMMGLTGCASRAAQAGDGETGKVAPLYFEGAEETLSGEIYVSAYESMEYKEFLEKAAEKFMALHPGVKVHIDSKSEMPEMQVIEGDGEDGSSVAISVFVEEDDQGKKNYISQVNTDLMSGTGADIYALDILPNYQYIQKNQWLDLAPLMEQDPNFDKEAYNMDVLSLFKTGDKLFQLPITYDFKYLKYNKSLFSNEDIEKLAQKNTFTLEELIAIASHAFENKTDENAYIFGMEMEYIFRELFTLNFNSFINEAEKEVNFDGEAFINLLNTLQTWEEKGFLPSKDRYEKIAMMTPEEMMQGAAEKHAFSFENSSFLLFEKLEEIYNDMMAFSFRETSDEKTLGFLSTNDKIEVQAGKNFAINSQTKNPMLAWEFLKFMSAYEMQMGIESYFSRFPLHKQALIDGSKKMLTGEYMGIPEADRVEWSDKEEKIHQEYLENLDLLTNQLNASSKVDAVIVDMVLAEMKSFFNHEKTAEEVANALQSKVGMYINE